MSDSTVLVTSLFIYPVKSCRGIAVSERLFGTLGMALDREWMLVTDDNKLLSQREAAELALVGVRLTNGGVWAEEPAGERVFIPQGIRNGNAFDVQLHRWTVSVAEVHPSISRWFSNLLGMPCRLVTRSDRYSRKVDPAFVSTGDPVGLADGYPFHLVNQSSLDDLNARLGKAGVQAVSMDRFRPNIVVSGLNPYVEDCWEAVQFAQTEFVMAKACPRCPIPSIDQQTGKKGKEPNRTLLRYRTVQAGHALEGSFVFGVNLVHQVKQGLLRVGDSLEVLRTGPGIPLGDCR